MVKCLYVNHFQSSLATCFTVAVYTYGGEFRLRVGLYYRLSKRNRYRKQSNSWEITWWKKHSEGSSRSKVLPQRLPLCCSCGATWIVTMPREMYMRCLSKQPGGMRRVHVCYTKGPNLKINCCFFHECISLTPWHWSHERTRAKTSRSCSGRAKGSSRAAPGMSASMNSADTGSDATLIDGLLFVSISSGLLSRGRTFEHNKLLSYFFRHAASQEVFYFSLSVLLA